MQRLEIVLGVFLYLSSLSLLKQGFSLNLELTDLVPLAGQPAPGNPPVSTSRVIGL